uniref:Uncharacterized protein n=1 Tax=Manihot esculenta TaxID=3983 RepID=A0A2C9V621_MANES
MAAVEPLSLSGSASLAFSPSSIHSHSCLASRRSLPVTAHFHSSTSYQLSASLGLSISWVSSVLSPRPVSL